MNTWGRHREVEKVKTPTRRERRAQLFVDVVEMQRRLGVLDEALKLVVDRDAPLRQTLLACSRLLDDVAAELSR